MAQVINEMDVPSHSFVFHGTGERYFLICVVNVLLTIITLGIYCLLYTSDAADE